MRRLNEDIAWVSLGHVFSTVIMLITTKVWASYLEVSQFGLMALIVGASSVLLGIALQPVLQAVFVSYPEHSRAGNGYEFRGVASALVRRRVLRWSIFCMLIGTPLTLFLGLHWVTPLVVIGFFSVDAWRVYEQMLFAAARRQQNTALLSAGDLAFRLACVWFFLHTFQPGAYTALFGNLLGAFLFVVFVRLTLKLEAFPGAKNVPMSFDNLVKEEVARLATPLLPSMILMNITEMGGRYLIGGTIGLHAAGLFVVSYGLVKRPYGMLNNVGEMAMTPVLKDAIAEDKPEKVLELRRNWIVTIGSISFLGAVLFYVLRKPLVALLLSSKYADAADLLFGLACSVAIYNVSNVVNWFSLTLGDSRAVLINTLVASCAIVLLTIILCQASGVLGAVWALMVGYSLQLVTSVLTFRLSVQVHKKRSQASMTTNV